MFYVVVFSSYSGISILFVAVTMAVSLPLINFEVDGFNEEAFDDFYHGKYSFYIQLSVNHRIIKFLA